MRVYIVWVKDKKVTLKKPPGREFREYFARRPYSRDTREILQAGMTFQLLACASHIALSRVSFPQSEACALHITRMRRVRIEWRQLVFASVSRVRPSCEISVKHSILLNYHFWYTLSVPTLYIPSLPTYVDVCYSKRKTLDRFSTSHTHLLERELLILSEKSL